MSALRNDVVSRHADIQISVLQFSCAHWPHGEWLCEEKMHSTKDRHHCSYSALLLAATGDCFSVNCEILLGFSRDYKNLR